MWRLIHDAIARELGLSELGKSESTQANCVDFIHKGNADNLLDIVELSFRVIDRAIRKASSRRREEMGVTQEPDDAIAELNHRFQQHGLGYQYMSGEIVRIDSLFVHAEVVESAVTLLHDAAFSGANAEFLSAHVHHREGRTKEAIADALKALESTLKAICDERGWTYPPGATAKPLLGVAFEKGLVPAYLEGHFTALRSTLEYGLPTLRNREAGHGQGAEAAEVPPYIAAYALHLAATSIVFLVGAHNHKK